MTLSEAIKIREIFLQIKEKKLPIKTSYQIVRFLQNTDSDAAFYSDKYREIINESAELNEDGSLNMTENGASIKIKPDKLESCTHSIQELETTPVDVKLEINLSDLENAELTVIQLYTLGKYIVE